MKDQFDIPEDVRGELTNWQKREEYYKQNIQPRLTEFSPEVENRVFDEDDLVDRHFEQIELMDALQKALSDLTDKERKIIDDNFFYDGKKPSKTQLAKAEGITSQVYGRKLKRILKKLKALVEMYINQP